MQSDTGEFVPNLVSEEKKQVCITLTATAQRLLQEAAQRQEISSSEVIERFLHSWADETRLSSLQHCPGLAEENREDTIAKKAGSPTAEDETEQKVALILESISDAFVAFDRGWHYTYVNQAAAQLLHKRVEDLLGKHVWHDVFPQIVGELPYQELHRAVREQIPVSWEEWSESLGRWLEANAYPSAEGVAVYFRDITDRKRAEEERDRIEREIQALNQALEERVAELQTLLDVIPVGIAIAEDLECQIIRINPFLQRLLGTATSDHLATVNERFNPTSFRYFQQGREIAVTELPMQIATARGTEIRNSELRLVRSDGEAFDFMGHATPLFNEQGAVRGCVGMFIDITERKQTEAILQESEARYRRLFENNPQPMWIFDAETLAFLAVNEAAIRHYGYSKEEFLAMTICDIRPSEDIPTLLSKLATTPVGVDAAGTWKHRKKDGSLIDVRITSHEETFLGRKAWLILIEDVTEQKRAEMALRQSEERLRLALLVGKAGIWDWDILQNQITWSEQVYEFHGLTLGTFGGRFEEYSQLIYPDDRERVIEAIRQALEEKIRYEIDFRILQPSGTVRWLSTSGGVIFNAEGLPIRMLGATRDITERKAVEDERERLLLSEQRAREEAEAANRIKDEFLTVLSHELRSPLNPILGWSKLLQTREFDESSRKQALETIERNAKLQTQLIDDLLDVSRILRGKMALNVSSVNLVQVIEAALETVRLSAEAKHIQIQTHLMPNMGQVLGDPVRLQQIVWNLLTNAVKFTPCQGRIDVCLEQIGNDAQIQVKDTGKGISSAFLPYVFDYFRQEDGKTTRKFGGLGLGLAIVRHLTEQHGGTIHAESLGEGQGATFTVRFPLTDATSTPDLDPLNSSTTVDISQLEVVVVDDEADMRELTRCVLEQQGVAVITVRSATEVLMVFDRKPPDILISDIGMPEIDGYMLMQQIRKRSPEHGGLVPAIALTAYAGEYDQQQALRSGFQKHIAKPVEPEVLIQAIADLVKEQNGSPIKQHELNNL